MKSPFRLDRFDNSSYDPGRNLFWCAVWTYLGLPLLASWLLPVSALRVALLRAFGAKLGQGVVFRPRVRVKFPWRLTLGDHSWIGEAAWIDNLDDVVIGAHVCISQEAYLCTGNHDWSDPAFGFRLAAIHLDDGAWACARCVLLPGSILSEGAVAGAGSVIAGTVPPYAIYAGNPASFVRSRTLNTNAVQPSHVEQMQAF